MPDQTRSKPTVAILGGAFDPIHHGHIELAQKLLKHGGVDEVRMMPANSHLYDKKMISPEHRLEMVRLATRNEPGIKPFDYEIRNHMGGSTYDFFKKLLSDPESQQVNYKMAIGQDNADTLHKWKNSEELKRMIPFIVSARAGSPRPPPDAWYLQAPHQYISLSSQYNTSSTRVKQLIQENHPTAPLMLHPDVYQYIRTHGLYPNTGTPKGI